MLTPAQSKVYEFVRQYIDNQGYSPTYREIAIGIGISPQSKSLISRHMHALVKAGYLTAQKEGYRCMGLSKPHAITLPLLGRIAAGSPIEAIADTKTVDIGGLLQGEGHFVLEVKGDSMIEEGIFDGDLVICKPTVTATEGEIIVALIDQTETTLKRISYKLEEKITLIPANAKLIPKSYVPTRIQIQGVFVGLLRLRM